jgi:2,4-dichlorophenol 6-monooxygenase
MMSEAVVEVPIVIVGGGGCGLNLSIFLSDFGIEHFLFEKHSDTSYLPKAHYINQRTMEIFRQHNMAERIRKVGCPIRYMGRIDWRSSLGGDGPYDRRVIGTVPAFGGTIGTPDNENYKKHSAELSSNLPLLRAEPIFRQVVEERNPGRVLFSQTVLDFEDKGDHVLVKVKSPDDKVTSYRAQYLIGADGGKTIGPKIGVQMEGPRNLVDFVSTHFKADLSKYCDGGFLSKLE